MQYRNFGGTYYLRVDPGEEVVASILSLLEREGVDSCTFTGIGGCSDADIRCFDAKKHAFSSEIVEGQLELVSLIGNVIMDDEGERHLHAHALFSFERDGEPCLRAGHLGTTTVLYTAEIEIRPVCGGTIGLTHDEVTGTGMWRL